MVETALTLAMTFSLERPMPTRASLLAVTLALTCLTACGGDDPAAGGKTKISVMGLPPTTQQANRDAFVRRVEEFETANPDIDVEPIEYKWETTTFQAKLAG